MKRSFKFLSTAVLLLIVLCRVCFAEIWRKVEPAGDMPPVRYGHQVTPSGNEVYITGGYEKDFKDVYQFRNNSNVPPVPDNPSPSEFTFEKVNYINSQFAPSDRGGHSAVYAFDMNDSAIIIYGGAETFEAEPLSTITYRVEDPRNKEPWDVNSPWEVLSTSGTPPPALSEHQAIYIQQEPSDSDIADYSKSMIVSGGYFWQSGDMAVSSGTYILKFSTSGNVWSKLQTTGASPCVYSHQMVRGYGSSLYVIGGKKQDGSLSDKVYCLDLSDLSWSEFCDMPENEGLYEHSALLLSGQNYSQNILIYGGKKQTGINEKVYKMDLMDFMEPEPATREWKIVKAIGIPPDARYGHSIAEVRLNEPGWSGSEGNFILFGGKNDSQSFNDTYYFYFSGSMAERVRNAEKPFNAPNPFNPSEEETKIMFYLPGDSADSAVSVKVEIYTLTGYPVSNWSVSANGSHNETKWNGRNDKGKIVANGGYVCLIHGGGISEKFKIAVLR